MDIVSRLKQYMDRHHIPVTQFADTCHIPRPTLSQLLSGRNKKVSDEVVTKIHEGYPTMSIMWLMFGEGNMDSGGERVPERERTPYRQAESLNVRMETISPTRETPRPSPSLPLYDEVEAPTPRSIDFGDFEAPATREEEPEMKMGREKEESSRRRRDTEPKGSGKPEAEVSFDGEIPAGKRVVSIVVYYNDNSYESFVPDRSGRNPFAV